MASIGYAQRTVASLPWGDVEYVRHGDGSPVVLLHRDLGPIGTRTLVDELRASHSVWARPSTVDQTTTPRATTAARVPGILGYLVCGFLGTLDMPDPVELMAAGRL